MIDIIIKVFIAIATYLTASKIVKEITGKQIHEHVFSWWCEIRDSIQAWLNKNPHLITNRIGVVALNYADNAAVSAKKFGDKITLKFSAVAGFRDVSVTQQDKVYDICTREVPLEEALKMFPGLSASPMIIDPITN